MTQDTEREIRKLAVELLESRRVELFIGYERGTIPMTSRPVFLGPREDTPAAVQAEALVWDPFCRTNLAVYLPPLYRLDPRRKPAPKAGAAPADAAPAERPGPRIGMVVKGCDLRSITTLLKEKQVPREKLVLLGVPCRGMIDPRRVRAVVGAAEVTQVIDGESGVADDTVTIVAAGREARVKRDEVLVRACAGCRYPVPQGTDYILDGASRAVGDGPDGEAAALDQMTTKERWRLFRDEMAKCIRCNACRQACPNCYCKECFADQTDIRWIGAGTNISDIMLYHLVRAFHQAGRCAECDACAVACPMDVNLRMLTHRLAADVRELFDFETSFDTEAVAPIAAFSERDSNAFITEP